MNKRVKLCLALFLALAVLAQYSFSPQIMVAYGADGEVNAAADTGDSSQKAENDKADNSSTAPTKAPESSAPTTESTQATEATEPTEPAEQSDVAGEEGDAYTGDPIAGEDPAAVEEEEEEEYPAVSFTRSADGMTVKIHAPEGALPEGADVKVVAVPTGSIENAVENLIENSEVVKAVDITFYDKDGEKIEPKKDVSVTFESSAFNELNDAKVVHIQDNGKAEMADNENVSGSKATFKSDEFSIYAVVDDGSTADEARVTVIFKSGSDEIATVYVKNSDTAAELEEILYDPGAGSVPEGQTFLGWYISDDPTADYTADTKPKNISAVRSYFADLEIKEGTTKYVHAMLFNVYHVSFKNEFGVVVRSDLVTYPATQDVGTPVSYEIKEPYTPEDPETTNFEGWNVESGENNIVDYAGEAYQNETKIQIKGDVVFSVNAPKGRWMSFVENGAGASYTPPAFYKTGQNTVAPTEPTRLGYTFDGWYENAACTGSAYQFGSPINQRVTLYAKWNPVEKASYNVIVWTQKVTGEGYDFDSAVQIDDADVGQPATGVTAVNGTGNNNSYARINGVDKRITGFHLQDYDSDVTVTPEGNTIVNVYYNRNEITLTFYVYGGSGYVPVTESSGAQGNYYTNSDGTGGTTHVYYNDGDGKWYTNRSWSGGWGGHWNYSGRSYDTVYSRQQSNQWSVYTTLTGLYGSTFSDLGVEWPDDYDWYENGDRNGNTSGTHTTFMDAFLIPGGADSEDFYGAEKPQNANSYVEFYKQNETLDGYDLMNRVETYAARNTTVSFSISDKYDGYYADHYQVGNGQVVQLGEKDSDGYYARNVGYTRNTLKIYFNRAVYDLTFMDGSYFDGHTGNRITDEADKGLFKDVKDIAYGANISSYNEDGTDYYDASDKVSSTGPYVFGGWYVDKTCNQPYTFSTMPRDGITVYAKWVKKEYRIFLHPNVDSSETDFEWGDASQETSFRISYGDQISGGNTINGDRPGYELAGWYYDADFNNPFVFETFVANDSTVTSSYDQKQPTELDKYGNKTSDGNKDAANDRFWIEKKLELYAKWRFTLDGAKGINVEYDANNGTNAPKDSNFYLDKAKAVAQAASTAPDTTQQFVCWVVQKWDGTKFVPATDEAGNAIKVFPGDEFTVLKTNAKVENYTDPEDPVVTKKYTVMLKAEYGPVDEPTPTHIDWYANNTTSAKVSDEGESGNGLQINEAVKVRPANTFSYTGYEFVGWARYAEGEKPASPTDDSELWLYYDGSEFHLDSLTGTKVTEVAADEKDPYHDLYAVWCKLDQLNYDANGGTGTMGPTYGKTGQKVDVANNVFQREGYEFTGWNTVANPTAENPGTPYSSGDEYTLTSGNDILYAQWRATTADVTVKHYLKGETNPFKTDVIEAQPVGEVYTATLETTYKGKALKEDSSVPEGHKITVSGTNDVIEIYYTISLTIKAETKDKTYDGSALNGEYTISGELSTDTAAIKEALGTAPSITNVSESPKKYQASITTGVPGYYVITNTPGTLTINPLAVTVTITGNSNSSLYNGADQSVEGYTFKSSSTLVKEANLTKKPGSAKITATGKNNGTYRMTMTADDFGIDNGNFTVTFNVTPGTLTINKRNVTITTASASKVYDGTALTNHNYTISGDGFVKGEEPAIVVTGSQTEVGSSRNTFTYSFAGVTGSALDEIFKASANVEDNYIIHPVLGTLTVTPATVPTPPPTPTPTPDGDGGGPAAAAAAAPIVDTPAPTTIDEPAPPKAVTAYWALINLLCAIATALLSLIMLIRYFGKRRYEEEVFDPATGERVTRDVDEQRKGLARIASLIPAIGGIIAFILTEDMSLPMTMVDKWTVLMVVILAIQAGVGIFAKIRDNNEEEDDEAMA